MFHSDESKPNGLVHLLKCNLSFGVIVKIEPKYIGDKRIHEL